MFAVAVATVCAGCGSQAQTEEVAGVALCGQCPESHWTTCGRKSAHEPHEFTVLRVRNGAFMPRSCHGKGVH